MDPTASELQNFNSLSDVLDWAGVVDVPYQAPAQGRPEVVAEPFRTEFLAALGKPTLVRELCLISETSWTTTISGFQVGGNPLTPAQEARVRSVRRCARLRCGLPAEETPVAPTAPSAPAPTSLAVPGSASAAPATQGARKMATVIDQSFDGDIKPLKPNEYRSLFSDYATRQGAEPSADNEPTPDQTAGVKQLITDDLPPYVNFAIWGPYGRRLVKKIMFVAFLYSALTGEWTRKELPGPPSFDTWWVCWRFFKVVILLLQICMPEIVDNYAEFIRDLHILYGPECWFVIYQADVRMRSEQWERIRRKLESKHAEAVKNGVPSSFNPAKPWECVMAASIWPFSFGTGTFIVNAFFGKLTSSRVETLQIQALGRLQDWRAMLNPQRAVIEAGTHRGRSSVQTSVFKPTMTEVSQRRTTQSA